MFENLVGNVVKFMVVGGLIMVGVSVEDNFVWIWVKDNGGGIVFE